MATKVFDPRDVTVIIGGHVVSGYADDTFVTVTFPDQGTVSVGADGEVVFNGSPDETATLELTLKQSSISNDVLSTLVRTARLSRTPITPVAIKGPGGKTLISAVHAWPLAKPEVSYGREVGDFTWRFGLSEVADFIGGIDAVPSP